MQEYPNCRVCAILAANIMAGVNAGGGMFLSHLLCHVIAVCLVFELFLCSEGNEGGKNLWNVYWHCVD